MVVHDFKNFPELSNSQLEQFGFMSPHKQIIEDFDAEVVKVHDGDTVTLRTDFRSFDFPLRLLDIDSPELSEGGDLSREWLAGLIEGEMVEIKIDRDNRVGKYGRLLGHVISRGLNINELAVSLKYAVPFGKKNEGGIPKLDKLFSRRQWFT